MARNVLLRPGEVRLPPESLTHHLTPCRTAGVGDENVGDESVRGDERVGDEC